MAKTTPRKGHHAPVEAGSTKSLDDWKPGSEPEQAANVATGGDFGVHVSKASRGERDYTSRNKKAADPGAAQPWSHESDGARDSGAGARDSGPGSGSGGDIDTDIVGVGTGGSGVSTSGPSNRRGADDTDGSSAQFASGGPATGNVPSGASRFKGTSDMGSARNAADEAEGADATAPNPDNDAFVGEISADEAAGGQTDPDGYNTPA